MCGNTNELQHDLGRLSDEELASRKGNRRAFEEIYRRHGDALRTYAKKRTGDAHVADDLVQDVFVRFASSKETIRQVRPFLYTSLTNAATDWWRDLKKRKALSIGTFPRDSGDSEGIGHDTPLLGGCTGDLNDPQAKASEVIAVQREEGRRLMDAIGCLDPIDQAILKAVHFEGLSYNLHFRPTWPIIREIALGKKAALGDGW